MGAAEDTVAASNEQTLRLVNTIQQNLLDATKSYISAISDRSADDLAWTPPPAAEQPDPKGLIEETFKFQSELLEANKAFAVSLAELWGQVEPPEPSPRAARTSKK
jgi:hypothetical protein